MRLVVTRAEVTNEILAGGLRELLSEKEDVVPHITPQGAQNVRKDLERAVRQFGDLHIQRVRSHHIPSVRQLAGDLQDLVWRVTGTRKVSRETLGAFSLAIRAVGKVLGILNRFIYQYA